MNGYSVAFCGSKRLADPIGVLFHSLDKGTSLRIAILTRGDLFPTDHGAAVKIVRTAEALSRLGDPCCVVTDDREAYLRFVDGEPERVPYPERLRAAEEWPLVSRAGQ